MGRQGKGRVDRVGVGVGEVMVRVGRVTTVGFRDHPCAAGEHAHPRLEPEAEGGLGH